MPTRITSTTASLLDHLYIRKSFKNNNFCFTNCFSGCLVTDITDHLANFTCIPLDKIKSTIKERPFIRCMSDANKTSFIQSFSNSPNLYQFYNSYDVDNSYNNFVTAINSSYEQCFPLIRISRSKFNDKDWVTKEIKESCNTKSKLYKKWLNTKNITDRDLYKSFANNHSKLLKKLKLIFTNKAF